MFKVTNHYREFITHNRSFGTVELEKCGVPMSISYDCYDDIVELDSNLYLPNKVVKLYHVSELLQTVIEDYVTDEVY